MADKGVVAIVLNYEVKLVSVLLNCTARLST